MLKSFDYALKGIKYCINNERNMRIHTTVAVYVLVFSVFFNLTKSQFAILILTILSVISAEMVNTAVEGLSDIFVSEYNAAAKNIKDIAAGAVFVCAGASILVGAILFSDIEAFVRIFNFFYSYPISIIVLIIFTIISFLYIRYGPTETLKKIQRFFTFDRKSKM